MDSLIQVFSKIMKQIEKLSATGDPHFRFSEEKIKEVLNKECLNPILQKRLYEEFLGSGPIHSLVEDAGITEIILDGKSRIFYEKDHQLLHHPDQFLSKWTFDNFIHQLCLSSKSTPSLESPFANGKWKNFRVHIISPPLVKDHPHITLRRHPKESWTFEKLKKQQWASDGAIQLIQEMIQKKLNILIVGPTSCGKTSVLNACLQSLPHNERAVIIEDTDELICPNAVSVKLLTRPEKCVNPIDQSILVQQSLRMRPDRLVMGEVRGAEAKDLIMALATGHRGSMGTLHADHHKQALLRLELLIQSSNVHWSSESIKGLIHLGIQMMILVNKNGHQRYLSGIYQITGLEKTGFLFECLFQRDTKLPKSDFTHWRRSFRHQTHRL